RDLHSFPTRRSSDLTFWGLPSGHDITLRRAPTTPPRGNGTAEGIVVEIISAVYRGPAAALLRFAQLAEVFRHGVGVALRDGLSARAADAAIAGGLVPLAAPFHFPLLDARNQRGVNALGQ